MRPAKVTQVGVGTSAWLPIDPYTDASNTGLYARITNGTPTYSIECTPDDVFNPTVTPTAYPVDITVLAGATANQSGVLLKPAKAVRINVTVAGSVELTAVAAGGI